MDADRGAGALGGGGSVSDALRQLEQSIAALSKALGGMPGAPAPRVGGVAGGGAAGSPCCCSSTTRGRTRPARDATQRPGTAEQAPPTGAGGAPDKLPGETSHGGLQGAAKQILSAAHAVGLKLISGHRPGDTGSGHSNGSAVDVANVPGGSRQGSPEMERFAEQMRAAGRAGDPNVGYVIYRQRIASARGNWEWRPMEDRGSNTQNHFDHVHVSTDPSL